MNQELSLTHYSQEEKFHLKQNILSLAQKFTTTSKAQHVKKEEVWARTICLKAFRDLNHISQRDEISLGFPFLPVKTLKVLDN